MCSTRASAVDIPLGVASAGLAILSHLPERELEAYLARAELEESWGEAHGDGPLRARVAETRQAGYATNSGLVVEGSWGMASAVFDRSSAPALQRSSAPALRRGR
ncbi:IclR family transcriptional regulator domain-containing protein [Nocardioides sp. CF8]|uniref:IclR family transcriptional regulator domain-containing protein n=1 Tax=Nocardioides sp. CF8 TaxID=110319 RepID=UPI0006879B66|nr:IclR family transcriptional regulator C-terminal domain-containing protein [Nocardioides sp. CF8]